MQTSKRVRGFTIIELMIVFAIIGLIAALATVGLSASKTRSRDTKRLSDLDQTFKALELGHAQYSTYPATSPVTLGLAGSKVLCGLGPVIHWAADASSANCDSDKVYMQGVQGDPSPSGSYIYKTSDPGNNFTICTTLESDVDFSGNKFQGSPMVAIVDPTGISNAVACP